MVEQQYLILVSIISLSSYVVSGLLCPLNQCVALIMLKFLRWDYFTSPYVLHIMATVPRYYRAWVSKVTLIPLGESRWLCLNWQLYLVISLGFKEEVSTDQICPLHLEKNKYLNTQFDN